MRLCAPATAQDYPPCRTSLGLLVSDAEFYPEAVRSLERLVRGRGMARLVVINKTITTGISDQADRHDGALPEAADGWDAMQAERGLYFNNGV